MDNRRSDKFSDDCSLAILLQPNHMTSNQVQLFEAARKNDVEGLEKLLANHANPNTRNNLDRTGLHWAAANGSDAVVDVLLRASANVNAADKYGMTPLLLAAWYGHVDVLEKLTKNKKTVFSCCNKQGMSVIHCAAMNDHVNVLEFLNMNNMLEKFEISKQELRGRTAIHLATERGHSQMVDYLVAIGCNLSATDIRGRTALHLASAGGNDGIVCTLLLNNAELINSEDSEGLTALHLSAMAGHSGVIHQLLLAKADINGLTKKCMTPLLFTASGGHLEATSILLSDPACDRNHQNDEGNTALHLSAASKKVSVLSLLVAEGCDVNIRNKMGQTALHMAAENGNIPAIHQLLGSRTDLTIKDISGRTPLQLASRSNSVSIVDIIIKMERLQKILGNSETLSEDEQTVHYSRRRSLHSNAGNAQQWSEDDRFLGHHQPMARDATRRPRETEVIEGNAVERNIEVQEVLAEQVLLRSSNKAGRNAVDDAGNEDITDWEDVRDADDYKEAVSGSVSDEDIDRGDHDSHGNSDAMQRSSVYSNQDPGVRISQRSSDMEYSASEEHRSVSVGVPEQAGDVSLNGSDGFLATSSEIEDAEDATEERASNAVSDAAALQSGQIWRNHAENKSDENHGSDNPRRNSSKVEQSPPVIVEWTSASARCADGANFLINQNSRVFLEEEDEDNNQRPLAERMPARSISNDYTCAIKTVLWKLAMKKLASGEWKKLAIYWNFTPEQIRAIEHQYTGKKSFGDHGYRMMVIWLECFLELNPPPNGNPMRELYDGLVAIDRRQLAEQIRTKCNRKSESRKSCVIS